MITPREKANENVYFNEIFYETLTPEWDRSGFPLVTQDFLIFALEKQYNYETEKHLQKVLIAPPLNQRAIRQKDWSMEEAPIEFFYVSENEHPDGEEEREYVVRSYLSDRNVFEVTVSRPRGALMQKIRLQARQIGYSGAVGSIVSPKGNYIAFIFAGQVQIENVEAVEVQIYKIVDYQDDIRLCHEAEMKDVEIYDEDLLPH